MSVAEELHKTIDELSEEQQQELLAIANQLLLGDDYEMNSHLTSETDDERVLREEALNQELLHRYQQLRTHPEQVVSARESSKRLREKHGWQ